MCKKKKSLLMAPIIKVSVALHACRPAPVHFFIKYSMFTQRCRLYVEINHSGHHSSALCAVLFISYSSKFNMVRNVNER